jgi:acetyl esterase/lipase
MGQDAFDEILDSIVPATRRPSTLIETVPGDSPGARVLGPVLRRTVRRLLDRGRISPTVLRLACLLDYAGMLLPAPPGSQVSKVDRDGYRSEWVLGPGVGSPPRSPSGPVSPPTAVLYFHGGGFFSCGLRTHRRLVARISAASGAPVLNVGYRQLPEVALAATIADCLDAYRALLDHGYPGEAVVFAGDSAGGYLAFAVALRATAEGLPAPAGIVALSPWLDLDCTHSALHENGALDPYIPVHQISALTPLLWGDDGPLESLLEADLGALPPVLMQVGSVEVLRSDAELMAAALDEAGVPVRLQIWLRQVHVFQAFADLVAEGHSAIADIGNFVRTSTNRAGGAVAA